MEEHGYKARKVQSWKQRHRYHETPVGSCPNCRPTAAWAPGFKPETPKPDETN